MVRWVLPVALAFALAPLAAAGCGTDASGVDTCKQIEDARCNAAASCSSIQLTPPYSNSGSASDACVRFYDVACLHGLAGSQPSGSQLTACVNLIKKGDCAVVAAPWNYADCSWLIPPNTPDAAADATDDGEAGEAGGASDAADATSE